MAPRLSILLCAALCLAPPAAGARSWAGLEGPVSATPPGVAVGWGPEAGAFRLAAAGEDVRTTPSLLVLETAAGWLVAQAGEPPVLYTPPRRDPTSGRPLRPDAPPDAVCPTGAEPECRQPGDPPPPGEAALDPLCRLRWSGEDCPLHAIPLGGPAEGFGDADFVDAVFDGQLGCPFWREDCSVPDPVEAEEPRICSFLRPQYCNSFQRFSLMWWGGLGSALFRGDPRLPVTWPDEDESEWAWLWEGGARYAVLAAGGDLAGFEGGTAHVLGPELSRDPDWHVGVPILLEAPAPAQVEPQLYYGVVPEPAEGVFGAAALGALAALARRRTRARREPTARA